ncbi:hypothetical protein OS493_006183 [Desmophyllum pertusum]|uniref:Uncharacterized protein n=1 Tax=Desmophyllum pertusum TaxID=174260 RepID=A0A9X0A556_9CNID|nr:hypothetical protein OS493_006183 [Desmophyllum pertusum]
MSYIGACFKRFFANCCTSSSCCCWCRKCVFCCRGMFYRDEFLLENFYEEITPQEWSMLEKEAVKVKGEAAEKIVLVETNVLPSFPEHVAATREQEKPRPSRSLVDYRASDFIKDEEIRETKSSKMRLNTKNIRSYTEPDFIAEMWKNPSETRTRMKSFKGIFRKRKYSRFTNEKNEEDSYEAKDELPQVESKVKMRTKILTRRSQRRSHEQEPEGLSRSLSPSSMFNDFGQIETSISFAAHVRRQGPGFSASCTQTLRTSDFSSICDLFESEVQSNVTFNPLFEDDDCDGDAYVKRARPRRYRLYTIDEESE